MRPTLRLSGDKQPKWSGNIVEVAQLGTGEKVTPFIHGELADPTVRIIGISDQYIIALTCDLNARPALTGA